MPVRGARGATTVEVDTPEAIIEATSELLLELVRVNQIDPEEICFAHFTTTGDLVAEFPAAAARGLGWHWVPMLCGHEMTVPPDNPRALPRCVRVALLYNTDRAQKEIRFVYLRRAQAIAADRDKTRSLNQP